MMWSHSSGLVVALLFVLCPQTSLADGQREGLARVIVEGVHVGPSKRGGAKWDGGGKLGAEDLKAVSGAISDMATYTGEPAIIAVTKGIDALAGIAVRSAKGDAPPDPRGTAMLFVRGKQVGAPLALPIVRNTFAPHWPDKMHWQHVPLTDDVRIRIVLFDSDDSNKPQSDDQLGTVVINSADLRRAARSGRALPIFVGDQSDNQIIAVKVTVMFEAYGADQTTVEPSLVEPNTLDEKDVAKFLAFFDKFVDAVASAEEDCAKVTDNLNAVIDANQEAIKLAREAKAAKKDLPKRAKDHMATRSLEIVPAMKKCGSHEGVRAAMKRM